MKLGLLSDPLGDLPLPAALDRARALGATGVEVATGGWSAAPHCDAGALLGDAAARAGFAAAFEARGLAIAALHLPGNPLHPVDRAQGDALARCIRLAGALGVETVTTHSGLPAGAPGDETPCWITTAWPPEVQEVLRYQWEEVLIPYWSGVAALARENGVKRIALEMAGQQCVYSGPALLRLREEVGPVIGAALNPAQLLWMGADPLAAPGMLGEALFHVYARDLLANPRQQAAQTLLDTRPFADPAARAWAPVALGIGQDPGWWRRLCYQLRMAGFEGWLSLAQEDAVLDPQPALAQGMALLQPLVGEPPADRRAG
jgi:sugar phosphate isomerase/epimerase